MLEASTNGLVVRSELRKLLLEERVAIDGVLELLSRADSQTVDLVQRAEELEPFISRRSALTRQLREELSEQRRREEDRSVRQFVLKALNAIGSPQPASFIQEFVWATERVDLDTRGFGALRRDEARSWRRRPGNRAAYIVPVLDSQGRAQSRWMARSDWTLAQRLVVGRAQRLMDFRKVLALFEARDTHPKDVADPYVPLLRRYGSDLTAGPPPDADGAAEAAWLRQVREIAEAEFPALKGQVADAQDLASKGLVSLTAEQLLWGVSSS